MDVKEEKSIKNIYIDIDSIMDTRLPILYYLDEELASTIIDSGEYFNRYTDSFKHITNDIFKAFYKYRNKTLLTYATPTKMLKLLSQYYIEVKTTSVLMDTPHNIEVYLNVYPYDLNLTECDGLIKGIQSSIGNDINVKIINMRPIELTPEWIDEHLAVLVMYDGMGWVELHTSNYNLINNPLIDVGLLTPALIYGHKNILTNVDDIEEFFNNIEKGTETLIKLKMLPIKDFSIDM